MLRSLANGLLSSSLSHPALLKRTATFAIAYRSAPRALNFNYPRLNTFGKESLHTMAETKPAEQHGAEEPKSETTAEETTQLPKLSAQDFRIYNGMADHMNYFVRALHPTSHHKY